MKTAIENSSQATKNAIKNVAQACPAFGEVIVHSNSTKRIFTFSADGSDERTNFLDLFQYCADELAASRVVSALAGSGHFGFDGNGIAPLFAAGSNGFSFSGLGREVTKIGYVGNTQSGNNWHVLLAEPDTDPVKDIVGMTQIAGIATVNIIGHGASVDSTIRIYNANESEYNGSHRVTGVTDADNFTFIIDTGSASPATKKASIGADPMTCAIHSEFLKNFTFANFTLLDTDPVAHKGVSTEETHGLGFNSHLGLDISRVSTEGIGDESIELLWCEDFSISRVSGLATPSVQVGGGGVVSIKNGCHHGTVDKFYCVSQDKYDRFTPDGAPVLDNMLGYGVNFKAVVHREEISNVVISNGHVLNPLSAGVRFNTSEAAISDIKIKNFTIIGGEFAIDAGGSNHLLSNIDIDVLTATKQTSRNVSIDRALADVDNFKIRNSLFDGSLLGAASANVFINGSNIKLIDNDYKNAEIAVHSTLSIDVLIDGGVSDNNGGSGSALPVIYDATVGGNMIVDGLKIINSNVDSSYFRGVHTVKNCPEISGATTLGQGVCSVGITNFTFNKKVGGSYLQATEDGSVISDNEFEVPQNPSAIGLIKVSGNGISADRNISNQTANPIVRFNTGSRGTAIGNKALLLTSGDGVQEVTGADYNIIADNQLNGRPATKLGANSILRDNL